MKSTGFSSSIYRFLDEATDRLKVNKFCFALAIMLALVDFNIAQPASTTLLKNSRRWHVYSAPDKSFKISTPRRLHHFKDPENSDTEIKSLDFYAENQLAGECKQPLYAVVVIDWRGDEKDPKARRWDLFLS